MTQKLYGGYAPLWECIGNNFIAKIQVPSFPEQHHPRTDTHSLHTPTNNKPPAAVKSPLSPSLTVNSQTHTWHTLSSFLVYIHSLSFSLSPSFFCCSLFALHWLKHSSRCRTTKFTSSINMRSPPLRVSARVHESVPWVGVSASWLSLIQDREGRLICIADSCATIGYILPHPEPQKKQTKKPKKQQQTDQNWT